MASAADATAPKPVDESLWWDPFVRLFDELDAVPLSSDIPHRLLEKLKAHRGWFLESVARFKPPSEASKLALESPKIAVGSHQLDVEPRLKEAALRASTCLCLNEVQSYILANRCFELNKSAAAIEDRELLDLVLLQYFVERQCLLKCIRRIFLHALHMADGSDAAITIRGEALQLVHDGLERNLLTTLQDLLSSASSEKAEIEFTILWVEETLIEDNLVLDILFILYYENFCSCGIEQWRTLCLVFKGILSGSYNIGKLAVSVDAINSFRHSKAQLLLILIEVLDLENILRMVHDEVPFRQGDSSFSLSNIQEMDAVLSSFSDLGSVEAGPLILSWGIFLCLLLSLPESNEKNILIEIDHIGYVRQAFEAAPFHYLLEVLRSDTLRESDGPVSGFLSILRTFTSAFIASYELENNTLNLIIDLMCEIYHGEESLSMQFWDKESFIDAPIRCLLYMLESEFPFRTVELVRLLSALCEGRWSAECVYNFLDKMIGITTLFEVPDISSVNINDIVETHHQLHIPGIDGLDIPAGTRGYVLKVMDTNSALVRWEYSQSGITLLLLRLAQEFYSNRYEELLLILNLLYRMVSFNMSLCSAVMYINTSFPIQSAKGCRQIVNNVRIDVVKIICALLFNLIQEGSSAYIVSICINILSAMVKCAPSHVVEITLRGNIFGRENNCIPSGAWLLSGGLARLLLAEIEDEGEFFPLTTSVLDFTMPLVESGAENNMVFSLVQFCTQYVLVNHVNWRCRFKYARWKMTVKVLEVMKSCMKAINSLHSIGSMIWNILVKDSSILNTLCRILCVSTQALQRLYSGRHNELKDIEDLELAASRTLDILHLMLANLYEETFSSSPAFVQTMLSSTVKPIPVVTASMSLISCSHNSAMQLASSRFLSMLCFIASKCHPHLFENACLVADVTQIKELSRSIYHILEKEENGNDDLRIAIVNFLISAAKYQPAILVSIIFPENQVDVTCNTDGTMINERVVPSTIGPMSPLDSILKHVRRCEILFRSSPSLLLSIFNLLKALWESAVLYLHILERIRSSEMFWKHLASVLAFEAKSGLPTTPENDGSLCESYRHKCHAAVLEIMAQEMFFEEKLLYDDKLDKQNSRTSTWKIERESNSEMLKPANVLKDILSTCCEGQTMQKLIESYSSSGYGKDVFFHAQISVCLCVVHLIAKVCTGDTGSLSLSMVKRLCSIYDQLSKHPAFSALTAHYSLRGYSERMEVTSLVLNDLYYHLQGELEGREITSGSFKELSHFLLDLAIFQSSECEDEKDILSPDRNICMYDIAYLQAEFRMELWEYSDWKKSKEVVKKMYLHMNNANLVATFSDSKHLALKALIGIISLYDGSITKKKPTSCSNGMPDSLIESSIKHVCKCLQATDDLLVPYVSPSRNLLNFLATQAELLLVLSTILFRQNTEKSSRRKVLPLSILIIKTSGLCIRILADVRLQNIVFDRAVKVLLVLLLTSVDFSCPKAYYENGSNMDIDLYDEASLTCLGLLPVLCKYAENSEYSNLSVASMDLMLKGILPLNTWLPILQKHLQLQVLVRMIQQIDTVVSVPVILSLFLTMACTKGGAQLLHYANVFSSLKLLFNHLWKDEDVLSNFNGGNATISTCEEHIWGLGLAIITSMIYSLGDDSSYTDVVDGAIGYFFFEKAYMTFSFLSTLHIPVEDQSKKRARILKTQTSLTALRDTELTLTLVCILAKHQTSWNKCMKEMDSELRETSIHLLGFISKGVQRIGDPSNRALPLSCEPTLKEEFIFDETPSFVTSKHGWFAVLACGSSVKAVVASALNREMPIIVRDQADGSVNHAKQTHFSDMVAIQIYRIAFLLLKFLCMQARAAVKRAEEVEFIDLAHFPELPMPEILHGLQDQAIAIVSELCEANKSRSFHPEIEDLCLLLLQILEKSLYLELCVSQSCGIRPVLGRVEDFSKEIKILMKALEPHPNLETFSRPLKQIIALVYPGLLQTNILP